MWCGNNNNNNNGQLLRNTHLLAEQNLNALGHTIHVQVIYTLTCTQSVVTGMVYLRCKNAFLKRKVFSWTKTCFCLYPWCNVFHWNINYAFKDKCFEWWQWQYHVMTAAIVLWWEEWNIVNCRNSITDKSELQMTKNNTDHCSKVYSVLKQSTFFVFCCCLCCWFSLVCCCYFRLLFF